MVWSRQLGVILASYEYIYTIVAINKFFVTIDPMVTTENLCKFEITMSLMYRTKQASPWQKPRVEPCCLPNTVTPQ